MLKQLYKLQTSITSLRLPNFICVLKKQSLLSYAELQIYKKSLLHFYAVAKKSDVLRIEKLVT